MTRQNSSRLFAIAALSAMTIVTTSAAQVDDTRVEDKEIPKSSATSADAAAESKRRERLQKAARQVHRAIDTNWSNALGGSDGFNSFSFTKDAVILHWKGPIPANVKEAIEEARQIAPLYVQPAKFTRIELKAAARELGKSIDASGAGSLMHAIYVENNEALRVEVMPGYDMTAATAVLASVNVPVKVTEGAPIEALSRADDYAPWKGGAGILAKRGEQIRSRCTSGFGVYQGSTRFMLTAAHCATAPDYITTLRGTAWIGDAGPENWLHDLLLINKAYAGKWIYDGGVGGSEFMKSVSGWDYVWQNDGLCSSGSVSGVICNIRPTGEWAARVSLCDSDGDCFIVEDIVFADRQDGQAAGQPGDSGGPIFTPNADNVTVIAKGIIVGRLRNQQNRLALQDFATAHRDFGIVPITY